MNHHDKPLTRKGAASFYVVIFAALVFTVIVLSFIRLMISESSQNTANDLSQSAYDSALTGVEDAKAAYAICLESNNSAAHCGDLYKKECNAISNILGYDSSSSNSEQSYSCVILNDRPKDYKISLSATSPVAVIPINAQRVKISWFSSLDNENVNNNQFKNYSSGNTTDFLKATDAIIPPVVSVGFIEQGNDARINNITLRPSSNNSNYDSQKAYDAAAAQGTQGSNKPAYVQCDSSNEPACSAQVYAQGRTIQYLVLSLPYHQTTSVGFTIQKYNDNYATPLGFDEQISVDSTGRANDYYRRVEARLQLAPLSFPYPEYALSASGSDTNSGNLEKNFWVTNNCWSAKNGSLTTGSSPCRNVNANTL